MGILSAQGMLFLPVAHGAVWLVLFALITLTTGAWFYDWGWSEVLGELTTVAGFFFFGAFGAMLRQADQARRRSDRLREQLETANEQLESAALQSQQLAIAEERNRLARELHDALGHRLTVAIVQLEGARRLMPSQPDRAATMIEAMRGELKEGLAELRRSVATLRTPITEALTLPKALTRLAEGFRQATGLALELSVAEPLPELPPGHQHALFRAAQECLTNIQRHAGARQAWLDLKADNGAVVLTASDDGRGFAPSLALDRYGLLGLQERAQQLGGNLSLDNRPDGGAQIAMRLPLPPPANHHG